MHPWVNYEQILNKCFIGPLAIMDPTVDTKDLFEPNHSKAINNTPKATPKTESRNATHTNGLELTDEKQNDISTKKPNTTDESVALPRFDWIQKMDSITTIFYTKSLSNPQVEVNPPNRENMVNVFIVYDKRVFANEITFLTSIQWPCQIKLSYEVGKVEVVFKKNDSRIWENYGELKQMVVDSAAMDSRMKYSVINKVQVNHNVTLLELERVDNSRMTVPLGKHIRVFGKVKGEFSFWQ